MFRVNKLAKQADSKKQVCYLSSFCVAYYTTPKIKTAYSSGILINSHQSIHHFSGNSNLQMKVSFSYRPPQVLRFGLIEHVVHTLKYRIKNILLFTGCTSRMPCKQFHNRLELWSIPECPVGLLSSWTLPSLEEPQSKGQVRKYVV